MLLYELLTGVLPFDSETLREGGIGHIRQIIRETDPKTPSTRLTKLGPEARKLAESRRTELAALAKCLHRELEWIPLKAMRKERTERYRSASELADDTENYLKGNPLIAGPLSGAYQFRKFVRRNQALVTGVMAVAVALTAGLAMSTALYFRAESLRVEAQRAAEKETAARADAERASTETQMITDFLREDVLRSAIQVRGREATVLDVLNAAVAKLDEEEFQSLPLVEASIRNTLSDTYFSLGHYTAAAQHQKRVYRIFAEQFGESDRRTSMTMNWLAVRYYYAGMYREAEPLYEQLVEDASRKDSPVLPQHLLSWKANLATTCTGLGRYEQAGQLLSTVLAAPSWAAPSKRRQFELHLGEIYREQGEYATAEDVLVKALKVCRQGSGPTSHSLIVRCMNELAQLYVALNDYEKAEELFKEGIEIGGRELPGADHPFTLRHVNGLGVLRAKQKDYEEAEALFDQALAGRQLKLGENHPETLETINELGVLRREQGDYEQAESLLRQALNGRQQKLGFDHPACFESMHELALVYIAQKDYEKAEPLLLDAYNGREAKLGSEHPHTIESLKQLVSLYEAWDKPGEAEKWRVKLAPSAVD